MTAERERFAFVQSVPLRYVLAVSVVLGAYLLRLAADPVLGDKAVFLIFVLPVVFTVLVSGRGPGILAGALSLVGGFSLIDPAHRFGSEGVLQALIFALVCFGLGW